MFCKIIFPIALLTLLIISFSVKIDPYLLQQVYSNYMLSLFWYIFRENSKYMLCVNLIGRFYGG